MFDQKMFLMNEISDFYFPGVFLFPCNPDKPVWQRGLLLIVVKCTSAGRRSFWCEGFLFILLFNDDSGTKHQDMMRRGHTMVDYRPLSISFFLLPFAILVVAFFLCE